MSETDEHLVLGGSRQVLMLSTVVMAVVAVAVLALGIQDPRLLRLGLVAALWAALLGAFATAGVRRELRDQTQRSQRREIAELRTELTVLQASLEQLLASKPKVEQATLRPESPHLLPQPRFAQSRHSAPGSQWAGSNEAPSTAVQARLTVSDLLAAHGTEFVNRPAPGSCLDGPRRGR